MPPGPALKRAPAANFRFSAVLNLALVALVVATFTVLTLLLVPRAKPAAPREPPSCRASRSPELAPPGRLPAVLAEYAVWHRAQRACLLDPACAPKPKLLVFRCPKHVYCLGLGDRIRVTLFPLFFAILTRRLFLIAWPEDPFPLYTALEPAALDWTPPEGFEFRDQWPFLDLVYCYKSPICEWSTPRILQADNLDLNDTSIDLYKDDMHNRFAHHHVISVSWKISRRYYNKSAIFVKDIFAGLNDTHDDMETMESAVYQLLFRPSKAVLRKMRQVTFRRDKPYYAVQLRTGIDVNETDEVRFDYINTHMHEAISSIFECLSVAAGNQRVKRIFLAADSTKAKKVFLEEAARRGFRVHLFREEIIHFLKVNFLDHPVFDDLCDRFLTVFADLYMLANSAILISSGSHFATFAHALSQNPNSTYIAYRPERALPPQQVCDPSFRPRAGYLNG